LGPIQPWDVRFFRPDRGLGVFPRVNAQDSKLAPHSTLGGERFLRPDRGRDLRAIIASGQVEPLVLPARSPNLNAFSERWVRSVKEECLSKVVLIGERSLRRALGEYVEHYHAERNHQGKGNVLLFRRGTNIRREQRMQCRERLGGLLRYYHQEAA
jgi:hypothetical protein